MFGLCHVSNYTQRLEELTVYTPYAASYQSAALRDARNEALSLMGEAIFQCTHARYHGLVWGTRGVGF